MSGNDAPKSAFELAMARLRQQDEAAGVKTRSLTKAQKARIAEIRKVHAAKLAEREILHESALRKAGSDPELLAQLEQEHRRDRERIDSERDRKIDEVRGRG